MPPSIFEQMRAHPPIPAKPLPAQRLDPADDDDDRPSVDPVTEAAYERVGGETAPVRGGAAATDA
ncbi:MAG: hypothetical protein IPK63_15425 [Candidatus Competibacteraceae bacterium]|jgi:hypothetical protein|nr:hypothetical protein [Candidatus Competibacteraceae bacterium]